MIPAEALRGAAKSLRDLGRNAAAATRKNVAAGNSLLTYSWQLAIGRTKVVPHLCLRCETVTTSITRKQRDHHTVYSEIPCKCGAALIPLWRLEPRRP